LSTALDLAILGQVFLNGGSYGGLRILAPTTVAAMTRNQIPGMSARFGDEVLPEACIGLGWLIAEGRKGVALWLSMVSPSTFWFNGAGGSLLWIDRSRELVGVYLPAEAPSRSIYPYPEFYGMSLFMDSVTAAIEEL
jgi:CubicO group peptidase (beta-lactamase class C family)